MEEPGGSTGSQRVGHDWATSLSLSLSWFQGWEGQFSLGVSRGCSHGAAGAGVILNVASLAPPRVGAACRPG